MTKAITINIDEKTEQVFRKAAKTKYGRKKGYLGKAIAEAMNTWAEHAKGDVNSHALLLLEKGLRLGGIKNKNRSDWHAR